MKKLSEIIGEQTAADLAIGRIDPGTKRFLELHKVTKTEYKSGSPETQDNLFNGTPVKPAPYPGKKDEPGMASQEEGLEIEEGKRNENGQEMPKGKGAVAADEKAIKGVKAIAKTVSKTFEHYEPVTEQEVTELVEMFGHYFSMPDKPVEPMEPGYHSEMYRTFAGQARDHDMHAAGHQSFLKDKNNKSTKERKFHSKAADAHEQLRDAYKMMADHHLDLLNQAHKAAMKNKKKAD